jgi:hypothetical protein
MQDLVSSDHRHSLPAEGKSLDANDDATTVGATPAANANNAKGRRATRGKQELLLQLLP